MAMRQEERAHAAQAPPARALSPRHKAAVIVRLLLGQGVSPGLDRLSPAQQAALARSMAETGQVDRDTLVGVIRDFTGRLDRLGLSMPGGIADALGLLEGHISPIARDDLRAEAEAGDPGDPWTWLSALDPDRLHPLLAQESAEVCAILLSKLGVAKAATLLSDLPPDRAEAIAHAVALTATVTPEMVARIGARLREQVDSLPEPAFRAAPVDRVGAILNSVGAATRDDLLDRLAGRDPDFARDVRRAIFTFRHIPARVEPTDVPQILRRVETETVIAALAAGFAAAPLSVEFLLENSARRMAEQLRDEAEAHGPQREEDGEAAMGEVVRAIRALEEEGALRLIAPED